MPAANGRLVAACVLAPSRATDASPADPLAIMARAMTEGSAEPPEKVFLAWLLSVSRDLDAAEAARRMLARFAAARPPDRGGERLIELLNETARWSSDRLACLAGEKAGPARQRKRRQTWR
jgi:hypothetical protein